MICILTPHTNYVLKIVNLKWSNISHFNNSPLYHCSWLHLEHVDLQWLKDEHCLGAK